MKAKSDKNDRKFFRLIDKNTFPSLMPNTEINDLRKVTVSLVKKRKFIYFDMNASNCINYFSQWIQSHVKC
jgi:hypothetical protein